MSKLILTALSLVVMSAAHADLDLSEAGNTKGNLQSCTGRAILTRLTDKKILTLILVGLNNNQCNTIESKYGKFTVDDLGEKSIEINENITGKQVITIWGSPNGDSFYSDVVTITVPVAEVPKKSADCFNSITGEIAPASKFYNFVHNQAMKENRCSVAEIATNIKGARIYRADGSKFESAVLTSEADAFAKLNRCKVYTCYSEAF